MLMHREKRTFFQGGASFFNKSTVPNNKNTKNKSFIKEKQS